MQFSRELRDDVAAGRITLSFRLWTRPQVKVGGRYPVASVQFEVDDIELVPFSSVTAADVRKSGETDLESLRRRAAEWVTREAMQLHGGMGYAEEFPVSRFFVDARVLSIFEGADETLCLRVIARRLCEQAL